MKMKKLFIVICLSFMLIFAGNALAGANFQAPVVAGSGVLDYDSQSIFNGGAFGISGAGGIAVGKASGGIVWGSASGYLDADGGGFSVTNTGISWFPNGFLSIGVYSESHNPLTVTAANADTTVDGFLGTAKATIGGVAGQGSLNGTEVTLPFYYNSNGFTGGIAGQGSVGGFVGASCIGTLIGSADAQISAGIEMEGASWSGSYRFIKWDSGWKTEGMRTDVGAFTTVDSSGYANTGGKCLAGGFANVDGGWKAAGSVKTMTVQTGNGGFAYAGATGSYSGAGGLNSNYNGSAIGYSGTSMTTYKGYNGSIMSSSAGMNVTSQVSPN